MTFRTTFMFATLTLLTFAPALATNTSDPLPTDPVAKSDDPIAPLYGSVVSVHNDQTGGDSVFTFQPNRSFVIRVTRNDKPMLISGLWAPNLDNTQICFQPSPLGGVTVPEMQGCLPLIGHGRGDAWSATNDARQTVDLSVTAPQ